MELDVFEEGFSTFDGSARPLAKSGLPNHYRWKKWKILLTLDDPTRMMAVFQSYEVVFVASASAVDERKAHEFPVVEVPTVETSLTFSYFMVFKANNWNETVSAK